MGRKLFYSSMLTHNYDIFFKSYEYCYNIRPFSYSAKSELFKNKLRIQYYFAEFYDKGSSIVYQTD